MIELYGNKIWNSNTPNKYKKVIIASEDSLDNICQELENSGLNYCAYIFNGEAHIAIGRATATNIDKLDIDYQTVIECNSKVYKTNNIIGTTTYDSIEDKLYRKYNTDFAYKIGQRLTEQGILFSGRIYGKTTTITVDKQYADTLNKISAELKEQRASFMSKSEVVQNESPEESKSVNEKISELHFNESQLSALAPSVKFIQTRNDDNLTDNFVSWFSDCTDFYESQLSALAEIYVDTYQSFSDKSLMFADTSRFNDLKQRFVNDNITAKLTENRGYSTTQLEIIREMVTYGMSESVINLLDYTFSIDEMQNFFTAYKNGSYEDLINLIADIKGTTRTDIEGQIEGGTYTPEIPNYDFLSKNLIFHNPSANHFTVMYFNPDSETGGQFVSTDINYNVAWRGNRDFTNDSERFWRYVEITGNQTLSDVGSKFFRESLNYFYSGEQIAEGLTTDTQKLIADVATAEMIKSGELIEPESFDVAKFDTLISEQKEITSNNSDKNTIVINAFAGPGAGKTTSCLEVAEKLKKQGFVTEYVQEYAKELVYDNSFDVAIGNIPFGDFSVNDSKYNSEHLKIHDYFFLKSLDKVRDGGIVAFVTSKGTLDKKDSSFRKTLAERADLVGAVRLPNNAFKSAGTEVTPDIIFLQKRSAPLENIPSWVNVGTTENGLSINNYFIEHPEMVLGNIVQGNKLYGRTDDTMCVPFADGRPLSELLPEAVKHITFTYSPAKEVISPVSKAEAVISKPEELRSQSYYKSGNEIYFYGSNSAGELVTVSAKDLLDKKYTTKNIDRLTAFMEIRDTLRELLEVQQHDNNDAEVEQLQHRLNTIYDNFYDKYGLIHSRYNRNILGFDGAYQLVASLEQDYDKNTLIKKSDIFTQRVNVPKPQIEHIDTASEALAVCIAEKGYIDFDYMSSLTDIDKASLEESLRNNGEIYPIPMNTENNEYTYQTASEYLSGDIYAKLDTAESYAAVDNIYRANVTALKAALPTPLKAGDIDVNLGATWIAPEYYEQFMYKLFETPLFNRSDGIFKDSKISVEYSEYSGKWFISHKAADKSVTVTKTYGACGYSGYQILEAALNLSEPKVYKDKLDEYGRIMFDKNNKPIRVIDVPATQVVQQKANKIRREFKNWLFSDPVRRSDIVDTYNRTFNCIKPREYDGSHLTFPGMNSNIELHEHQKNAIAHAIYGGNTLFAHSVGAGKTFEMIATAMECKRLGLCHKSLFAVPNHLTEQVGADFLKLYPNANILVATKDDFKAENRKRLMSKIATGNYDAVIIGHTQLKMLPLSPERQENIFKEQIDNIVAGIAELKYQEGNSFKVKDMERTKRSLEQQLEKLQSSKKDNTVYFEELGIDKLFVDEAHEFKNLFCTTKLQNVSGISSRASQRATELFAKCRYLDEKTGGKGVVFATGTPLSNSVTELHTMMRYLNYDFLASHNNMQNFDNWVSTFGVQKKEYELAPAGNKFKERTRIAEYANLPELMSMFKTIADVRTADTLNLKVPDCELHIVDVEPTELQTELVEELSDRADEVNNGSVDPSQDNMLKITGDGRKLGLDPRLINPSFEDDPGTKLNVCVNNVFDIYEKTSDKKLTQIVFCDLGVPSKNSSADGNKDDDTKSVAELDSLEESGKFCVYDDIRDKLIAKGVSADEIAYIHNAKSETQKSELFAKVRSGEVRILLGSTGKMGTGTNVQDRIIALHDLDVPWRPSDLEQRRGRMVRQGNINDKVHLYRYVTKGTFDAYSYQLLEKKQKFISQIMTSKEPGRKCADVDQAALTYSEIKALCTGDERIREKLTLENRVKELQALKSEYNSTRYELEDKVNAYPEERKKLLLDIGNISKDMETVKNIPFDVKTESYRVKITIGKDAYSLLDDESRKVAAKALTNAVAQVKGDANKNKRIAIGGLGNFGVEIINDGYFLDKITATLRGNYTYSVELGVSSIINLKKIENLLFKVENVLNDKKSELNKLDIDYKTAQNMLHKPFEFEDELNNSTKRLDELTTALNIDMSEHKVDKPKKTHYFGKDFILGKKKSSKQIQNNEVMKSEPKRSEPEL